MPPIVLLFPLLATPHTIAVVAPGVNSKGIRGTSKQRVEIEQRLRQTSSDGFPWMIQVKGKPSSKRATRVIWRLLQGRLISLMRPGGSGAVWVFETRPPADARARSSRPPLRAPPAAIGSRTHPARCVDGRLAGPRASRR